MKKQKNRAKCRLCESIIESFHVHDYVECKCGEIAVDGGDQYWKCRATDWKNFLRLNDDDTVFEPKIVEKDEQPTHSTKNVESSEGFETTTDLKRVSDAHQNEKEEESSPLKSKTSKKELLDTLSEMIKTYEDLPPNAMVQPISHYDLLSVLMLAEALFRSDCNEES